MPAPRSFASDRTAAPSARAPRGTIAHVRMTGSPGSGGTCFGTARIVRRPEDLDAVRPGEIVVTPVLSAAFAAVLTRAGAFVAEAGGALSNGAVLARELRIPVVVAVAGATRTIVTGDELLLDGTTGAIDRYRRDH